MDPFITGTAGTSANLLSPGGAGGSNRMNNAIKYNAPANMGGFNAEWAYAFGEVAGNTTASSENGGNVGYMQGPFSVKAAYHTVNTAASLAQKVQWVAGKYDYRWGAFYGLIDHAQRQYRRAKKRQPVRFGVRLFSGQEHGYLCVMGSHQ
jgi:hypothetical protein